MLVKIREPSGIYRNADFVGVDRRFIGAYCLNHQGDDSSPWWLRQFAPLKRRSAPRLHGATSRNVLFSYSPPWKREVSNWCL